MSDDSSPDETKDIAIDEGETDEQSDDTQVSKSRPLVLPIWRTFHLTLLHMIRTFAS